MMKKIILLTIFALFTSTAWTETTCEKWIQGANIFEEFDKGEIKENHSRFALNDWTPNSEFEFFVIPSSNPADLVYDLQFFEPKKKVVTVPLTFVDAFAADVTYKAIATDTVGIFADVKSKVTQYRVRVQQSGKDLCVSQKFSVQREIE